MTTTYLWIVFAADTSEATIQQWIAAHPGINGWFNGIPPRLIALAEQEGWSLPHLYTETVTVEG